MIFGANRARGLFAAGACAWAFASFSGCGSGGPTYLDPDGGAGTGFSGGSGGTQSGGSAGSSSGTGGSMSGGDGGSMSGGDGGSMSAGGDGGSIGVGGSAGDGAGGSGGSGGDAGSTSVGGSAGDGAGGSGGAQGGSGGTAGAGGSAGNGGVSGSAGNGGVSGSGGGAAGAAASGGSAGKGGSSGNGGSSGGPGSGGSAGNGGSSGSGGNDGCPGAPRVGCDAEPPATTNVPLTHDDGWVQACSLDLVGALFTVADAEGSSIAPQCFSGAPTSICVQGTAARAVGDPADYWGAAVGLRFCNPDTASCAVTTHWYPQNHGVLGFTFNLTGPEIPQELRLTVRSVDGVDYCAPVGISPFISIYDLRTECWTTGGDPYDGAPLMLVQWNVVSHPSFARPFDFCIENLEATLEEPICECPFPNQYCNELGQCVGTCRTLCGEYFGEKENGACNCDSDCWYFDDCCEDICDAGVCDEMVGICI